MKGVCDTPLHLFDEYMDETILGWWATFAHIRAYAIRPYTCSVKTWVKRWWNLHLFAENVGKMVVDWWAAFAHFRAYAIRPYSYSVENELLWGKYNTWKVFVWSSVFQ